MPSTMPFSEFVEINPKVKLEKGIEYPFVEMGMLTPRHRYIEGTRGRMFKGGGTKFESGDTLLARITPCLENGKIAQFVNNDGKVGFGSTEFFVFREREGVSDPGYVFYLSLSDIIRKPAEKSMAGASGRQRADLAAIKEIEVPSPPLPTQRKIAGILSAYDDLIENNLRRIKILEQMAQAIYREWFVNFRFPGHQKVKMVDSELGPIPQGWEVGKLGDIASVNLNSYKANELPEEILYVNISSVSTGKIDEAELISATEAPGRARRKVKHGDTIWSSVRPNRKSFSLIIDPPENLIVSTGFAVLSPEKVPYSFLYQAVTTDDFVGYLTSNVTGSAYPAVNAKDYENADLLIPPDEILDRFHGIVEPQLILKHKLLSKNANLRRTRDLLLPRLISGKLDVADLDINTGEVA